MVPDREKDGEKFQKFQECFQEVLQSCGVAVEEPGLQVASSDREEEEDAEKEEENQLVLQPETKEEAESKVEEETKMETDIKVETEVEVESSKQERQTVRYYCHGCSLEMPGVAAGLTCPRCYSGNDTRLAHI